MAGAGQARSHHLLDLGRRPLAHRTGDHPGLAEPAPPGAAPEDLDVEPVVHHLGERDQLTLRVRPRRQVSDRALLDDRRGRRVVGDHAAVGLDAVQRRYVHPGHGGQGTVDAPSPPRPPGPLPRAHHLGDLADHLLAVAQHGGVHVQRQRLGVEGAVAADEDERVVVSPVGGAQRHHCQVDARQDVGVGQLGGQVEGQDVEVGGRACRLDAEQGHPGGPQLDLEVDPRCVAPLGGGVVPLVEHLDQDLKAGVRQTHLVGVRVGEEPGDLVGVVLRLASPVLEPDVPGRLLDAREKRLNLLPDAPSDHVRQAYRRVQSSTRGRPRSSAACGR